MFNAIKRFFTGKTQMERQVEAASAALRSTPISTPTMRVEARSKSQAKRLTAQTGQKVEYRRDETYTDPLSPMSMLSPMNPMSPVYHQTYDSPAPSHNYSPCYDSGSSYSSSYDSGSYSSSCDSGSSYSDSGSSGGGSFD